MTMLVQYFHYFDRWDLRLGHVDIERGTKELGQPKKRTRILKKKHTTTNEGQSLTRSHNS